MIFNKIFAGLFLSFVFYKKYLYSNNSYESDTDESYIDEETKYNIIDCCTYNYENEISY